MKRSTLKRKTTLARGGPLKRSAIKRQPMKRYRKPSAVAKADALAAAIVHARGCCAFAQSREKIGLAATSCRGPLEQHHARGRGKGFRWRTESHLLLCAWHHRLSHLVSAHGGPRMFALWMRRHHPEILAMPDVPETAEQAVDRMTSAVSLGWPERRPMSKSKTPCRASRRTEPTCSAFSPVMVKAMWDNVERISAAYRRLCAMPTPKRLAPRSQWTGRVVIGHRPKVGMIPYKPNRGAEPTERGAR